MCGNTCRLKFIGLILTKPSNLKIKKKIMFQEMKDVKITPLITGALILPLIMSRNATKPIARKGEISAALL